MVVDKVAVVTGSNKGIGLAIVKELCNRGVQTVYLTARDVIRGTEAVNALKQEGLSPLFHQLDVTDSESVRQFADHIKESHGGLDILINNAAVATEHFFKTTYEDSKQVIETNYISVLTVQKYFFPILNDNARVINMSSDGGHISNLKNTNWIKKLTNENIKLDDINDFVEWFLNSVKENTFKKEDFADSSVLAYRVSKIALCALTRLQQKEVDRGISVNSIHPGFVKTDMTSNFGILTPEEAGKAPVYLALDVDQSVRGKYFWFDKTEKNWSDPKLNLAKLYGKTDLEKLMKEANKMYSVYNFEE